MISLVVAALILCFPALVLAAAVSDATSFTIPNWMSLALLAIFPVAALAAGLPPSAIGLHFAVGTTVLVVGIGMFVMRWIGGGDAKVLAAVALWVGWPAILTLLVGAALAGGLLAIVLITLRSDRVRPVIVLGPPWINRLADKGEGVPYGVAIAAGALFALPSSPFGKVLGL